MVRRSLAFRLLCLSAAAATLPALVIAIVLRTISSHALEASIQQNQTELAQRVADEVNGEIHHAQDLMGFVARMPGVVSGNLTETHRALQSLMRSLPAAQEAMAVSGAGEERVKIARRGAAGRLIKRKSRTPSPTSTSAILLNTNANVLENIFLTKP